MFVTNVDWFFFFLLFISFVVASHTRLYAGIDREESTQMLTLPCCLFLCVCGREDSVQINLKIKIAYIHRYTLLHWYKPWIEATIRKDKQRVETSRVYINNDDDQTNENLELLSINQSYNYYNDYDTYDDIFFDRNPCNSQRAAARHVAADRFRLPFGLLLYGLVHRYVECVHLYDDRGIFKRT